MSVDRILAASRKHTDESLGTVEWLNEARVLMRDLTADSLLESSQRLIEDHPSDELIDLLNLPADERRAELSTIRQHRRLFLVARDGIILSTNKHRSTEYDSLRRLCFTLGRYADSAGTNDLFAITARSSMRNLKSADKQAHEHLHDDQRLRIKYLQALDGMGVNEAFKAGDLPQSFHQRRKTFRRAVNALVLTAADTQDNRHIHIAEEGLRINTAMGHISDRMH